MLSHREHYRVHRNVFLIQRLPAGKAVLRRIYSPVQRSDSRRANPGFAVASSTSCCASVTSSSGSSFASAARGSCRSSRRRGRSRRWFEPQQTTTSAEQPLGVSTVTSLNNLLVNVLFSDSLLSLRIVHFEMIKTGTC